MKFVRKMYDWVLDWAATPYGSVALFIFAFAEASFFPIPPDPLLIALVLGARKKAFRFALNCSTGSVLGALLGYAIGYYAWWTVSGDFTGLAMFFFNNVPGFTEDKFLVVKTLYDQWNFWIIFTAGFTPLPYKVFTISGGAFDINLLMFVIASVVGRSARFFLVASLIRKFGVSIKSFIDKYFNWLAILFTILLIGGFALVKYLL